MIGGDALDDALYENYLVGEGKQLVGPPIYTLANPFQVEVVHVDWLDLGSKGGAQVLLVFSKIANCESCVPQPLWDHRHCKREDH